MSYTQPSKVHASISPKAKALKDFDLSDYLSAHGHNTSAVLDSATKDLLSMGANISPALAKSWAEELSGEGFAMDALQPGVTTASIVSPVQFLQAFLPGFVNVITAARKIDEFTGLLIAGSWEDEQIVRGILEQTGTAVPYGDYTNLNYAGFNANWNTATIVRFQEGINVGQLEQMRGSAANIDAASQKRIGATRALEINRNTVGFFGFNAGANRTFGFLNAEGLPAYTAAASGLWANATYLEIVNTLLFMFNELQTNSQDNIDARKVPTKLAVATSVASFVSRSTEYGYSVTKWLDENYPLCDVISAPQLNNANGNENVAYLYPERIEDDSTDGGKVFIQPVPAKFRNLGTQQLVKSFKEGYSNATAGVMCQRPSLVVRITGI